MDLEKFTHIEGPVSLSDLRLPRLNKRFYVFGDHHVHNMKCVDSKSVTIRIDKFLEKVILGSGDKIIDLFLELDFPDKDGTSARDVKYQVQTVDSQITYLSTPDYITDIYHLFYDCLQADKRKCRYGNVRAHYTDIRYIGVIKNIMDYVFDVNEVYKQIQYHNMQLMANVIRNPRNRGHVQDLRPIIRAVIEDGFRVLDMLPKNYEDMYSTGKIDKQLKNINDPKILRAIHKYYDGRLWNSLVSAEESYVTYTENSSIEDIKIGLNHMFDYSTMLFDVYVIGRMFRNFGTETVDNIILYLGDDHSTRIVDFLSTIPGMQILGQQRSETIGVDMQCLDITRFQQPFFV